MPVATLTTDFGLRDHYAGAMKGALLRHCPALQLVDISHEIKPFDIQQGAYLVGQVWPEFPEGTIHLIGVHCIYAPAFRYLAARRAGHFFLAPDNGVLGLLAPDWPEADVRELPNPEPGGHFPVKAVFAQAAAHLAEGRSWEELGRPAGPILQRIRLQPVMTPQRIRGTVIHIDNFDNVVVNISRELFESARNGRAFALYFRRHDPLTELVRNYADVPEGEPLCLFNSAGLLEISINLGRAATLLGLKLEDVVEVVFSDPAQ